MCSILSEKAFLKGNDFARVARQYCLVIVEDDKEEGQVAVEQFRGEAESWLFLKSQVLCTHYKLALRSFINHH